MVLLVRSTLLFYNWVTFFNIIKCSSFIILLRYNFGFICSILIIYIIIYFKHSGKFLSWFKVSKVLTRIVLVNDQNIKINKYMMKYKIYKNNEIYTGISFVYFTEITEDTSKRGCNVIFFTKNLFYDWACYEAVCHRWS